MFGKLKNLERAFQHIRLFTSVVILGCVFLSCYVLHKSFLLVSRVDDRIYVLADGKALEAFTSERGENIPVEARDHVARFHRLFFGLDPDEQVIRENIGSALYLADESAKRIYDDLQESGFYLNLVSGNVSQKVQIDSITIEMERLPIRFRFFGKQIITRSTRTTVRSLVTGGELRIVSRSENNPHGLLIERWQTFENKELSNKKRH
ncbi:conjugative transposon protein TraK [Sphingobacterium cellulitidis]|uniref:Conjugative transposon protein TraK n=1 Tax=Sphingobacterium cellulitidis TaxID=1768011 RepID=A0A8H9G220_9SPHI|nr:conjugative transposon protein TraK [Sphingobacterium soli]MBA8986204.1 conjugative transposon TraK protein [Sphingobacterium soli]GGE18433.1 conjugative transposon protein TraK [Sphingobacterium soli]